MRMLTCTYTYTCCSQAGIVHVGLTYEQTELVNRYAERLLAGDESLPLTDDTKR